MAVIGYEIKKQKEELEKVDLNKVLKETNEVLSLENITKEMYEKLIEKIEFDDNKNIFIKFRFEKMNSQGWNFKLGIGFIFN